MTRSESTRHLLDEIGRLRSAIDASGDVLYDWDLAADTIRWTGRAADVFGASSDSLPISGDDWSAKLSPEDLPPRMRALTEHLAGLTEYDVEYRIRMENGSSRWIHDRGSVELSASGVPERMQGTLRHIDRRKQTEARLEYLVNYDELTGHFNKLRLREALEQSMARAERAGKSGAFVVIGIDKLGMVNTAYGCDSGDAILVDVARCLDDCLRMSDTVGRLGGDRFGIVLEGRDEGDADVVADRVLSTIRSLFVDIDAGRLHVSASAGVASYPSAGQNSLDIITHAESALLDAKAKGRDCVHAYEMTEEQRSEYRNSVGIGTEVREAIKEDRLALAYQPLVEAQNGETSCYECLLRMYAPDGSLVPAGRFIPVVEKLGLMRAVDRLVLDLVLQDLELNRDVVLAFNISGLTVADRSWLRSLQSRLRDKRQVAERMIVEITETAALYDNDESARFVESVRALGCRVAIDDFGAGYTTFHHLKTLPVDIVKIDGSFVRDIQASPDNQLFVRNLLSLAKALDLTTVAECVETQDDSDFLKSEGVDLLQGYFFGKPELQPSWQTIDRSSRAGRTLVSEGAAAGQSAQQDMSAAILVPLPATGQSQK
ncbi:bifunctional diguanylate cyclase/phosphodiesterase [Pelagibius sp. Alg239-R121]|uniref:putative bifunctional diguanylate cyclase/phosphodiesterase n=1 Tax=Pelagibius sp. Alg239-R121 TaxID=2993448 RepID=UPI0024A65C3C|nr:GGDEF domain-containing phosphodiesterase [Pelagibius sp. Alg239-R121]